MTAIAHTALPSPLDLDAWHDFLESRPEDERYELVQGIPEMVPSESLSNLRAAFRIGMAVEEATGGEFVALAHASVAMAPRSKRPTARIPDLVVVPTEVAARFSRTAWWLPPTDVALVVELVSPSSSARDWLTKADEYARAGVPRYLVVDPERQLLSLFEAPVDGAYPPPAGDGASVTLQLGEHSVRLTLADIRL